MNDKSEVKNAWRLVFLREMAELWIWGKALYLIFLFSILLGVMAFVFASNSELDLIPPKEMVFLILEGTIVVGVFIGLIIGADCISGERERATLEALLLTPTSRRQIMAGKFLAAITPWPAAMIISIPYMAVLAQGDEAFGQGIIWGSILGTLLAPAFTGFGILVSSWSNNNKGSLFVSLTVFLLFLIPTQFPGSAQTGAMGRLLKEVNPIESVNHFLEKILVNNRTLEEVGIFLMAPILFATIVFALLFFVAGPGLRLESGGRRWFKFSFGRTVAILMAIGLPITLVNAPAGAQEMASQESKEVAAPELLPMQISIDADYKMVKTGDHFFYNTVVTNNGTENTPPSIVAMNIINIDGAGDPVDPEDWSPQRTQYIESIAPGESLTLSWKISTIFAGDYMIYMVLIPAPDGPKATIQPIASSGIHVTVEAFTRINPGGVLPYVVAGPIVLIAGMAFLFWYRRRRVETVDDSTDDS